MEALAIAVLILGITGALILRRHLREAKLLRLREITHEERMAAMRQDLPPPESDDRRIESLLVGDPPARVPSESLSSASVHWVRLMALVLGLTGLFGGIGIALGFYGVDDTELSGMWSIGLVPIFIGIGLLIFVRLSRRLADKMNGI